MRKILIALGFLSAFLFAAPAAAQADAPFWRGPYYSLADCEIDLAVWREAGGAAGGCGFRLDAWYYRAWPMP